MVTNHLITMKRKYTLMGVIVGLLSLTFTACEDNIDPLIEELEVDRVFSPTGLSARVQNLTTIELTWSLREDADSYVVEYSEDSLQFNTIIRTVTVMPNELPLREIFEGETRYSARVKGVSADGLADSKWAAVTIMTDLEDIFMPIQDGDIGATEATLRWPAGSEVTRFVINPGNVEREITAPEKDAGVATITGLTGFTDYTVRLYNNAKQRGSITFKTLFDGGTLLSPEDDLNEAVIAASAGDVLVLSPGEYTAFTGNITLDKSITIRGLYPFDKPKVQVEFTLADGAGDIELADLDMNGGGSLNTLFLINTAGLSFNAVKLSGCNIYNYGRQLIYGNSASSLGSFTVDNCVVSDFVAGGGDFIDFRTAHVSNVTITNSTFVNCAPGRDFIRLDNSSGTFPGLTSTVLIDKCTIYGVSNNTSSTRRILYVRFIDNASTVKNTIIAETTGIYSNQPATTQPVCSANNYFNAQRFYDAAFEAITNLLVDNSGTHTTLDPGFVDAAGGDFTVTNQTLIDNNIGDPRWLQ